MTSLKKSYCEIINDNSQYSFNKELLAIIKVQTNMINLSIIFFMDHHVLINIKVH